MSIEELTGIDDAEIDRLLALSDAELQDMFKDLLPNVREIRAEVIKEAKASAPKVPKADVAKEAKRAKLSSMLDKLEGRGL